ncbi:MAG: biopolymer transporter ExbD [Gemmatimonadales bacterium]|nr:biopolymer transporter ExbD [Gemmatimonadales bacterium]
MGMQVGGSEGGVKSEPNVVPMIDIMLVLLIIFMIVTPVISSGFTAQMPLAKNVEARPEDPGDVVLGMDKDGGFYLDPGTGEIGAVRPDELEEVLRQIFEARDKDKILYFRADRDLPFGEVQRSVEIARAAGVRVLAAVMDEQRDEGAGGILGQARR